MPSHQDETLLRMRARDAGFDLGPDHAGEWLVFRASGNLATLWLAMDAGGDGGGIRAAAAPAAVTAEVGPVAGAAPVEGTAPEGAAGRWHCTDWQALDRLCRRIAILGHVLPDQVLRRWEREVADAEQATEGQGETERLAEVLQRVGQDHFRAALEQYWGGRCAITGCTEQALLRASHAKPWKDATDRERLDVHNGLLLVAHLDAAFDAGLIAVGEDGVVLVSRSLGAVERRVLGVDGGAVRVRGLAPGHGVYLKWHREHVFQCTTEAQRAQKKRGAENAR